MNRLVIASRGSNLALWQAHHIKERLETAHPALTVEILVFKTKGDKILDVPLAKIGGKGLFVKELEDAMLRGDAHIAVHSLKDVPVEFEPGLVLGAVCSRADVRDALLSEKYDSLEKLPNGAVVGTTSLRRRMQILAKRPDLVVNNLRGNVETRIKKMQDGLYDAIILASAGIHRLGLEKTVKYFTPIGTQTMIPPMGQAALGIEAVNDPEVLELIKVLDDPQTRTETTVERKFVEMLDGGCQVPIGVNAELQESGEVSVTAIVGLPNGKEVLVEHARAPREEYETLGVKLAEKMIAKGAKELLERAEALAFKD